MANTKPTKPAKATKKESSKSVLPKNEKNLKGPLPGTGSTGLVRRNKK